MIKLTSVNRWKAIIACKDMAYFECDSDILHKNARKDEYERLIQNDEIHIDMSDLKEESYVISPDDNSEKFMMYIEDYVSKSKKYSEFYDSLILTGVLLDVIEMDDDKLLQFLREQGITIFERMEKINQLFEEELKQ